MPSSYTVENTVESVVVKAKDLLPSQDVRLRASSTAASKTTYINKIIHITGSLAEVLSIAGVPGAYSVHAEPVDTNGCSATYMEGVGWAGCLGVFSTTTEFSDKVQQATALVAFGNAFCQISGVLHAVQPNWQLIATITQDPDGTIDFPGGISADSFTSAGPTVSILKKVTAPSYTGDTQGYVDLMRFAPPTDGVTIADNAWALAVAEHKQTGKPILLPDFPIVLKNGFDCSGIHGTRGKSKIIIADDCVKQAWPPEAWWRNVNFTTGYNNDPTKPAIPISLKNFALESTATQLYTQLLLGNVSGGVIDGVDFVNNYTGSSVSHSLVDVYTSSKNIDIRNCTFTELGGGGVGLCLSIRNVAAEWDHDITENILVEHNEFTQCSGDEVVAVYGVHGLTRNVKVRNNKISSVWNAARRTNVTAVAAFPCAITGDAAAMRAAVTDVTISDNELHIWNTTLTAIRLGDDTSDPGNVQRSLTSLRNKIYFHRDSYLHDRWIANGSIGSDPDTTVYGVRVINQTIRSASIPVITSAGTGFLKNIQGTASSVDETITLTWTSPTAFTVVGSVSGALGSGTTGIMFTSSVVKVRPVVPAGYIPFSAGDTATFKLSLPYDQMNRSELDEVFNDGTNSIGSAFMGGRVINGRCSGIIQYGTSYCDVQGGSYENWQANHFIPTRVVGGRHKAPVNVLYLSATSGVQVTDVEDASSTNGFVQVNSMNATDKIKISRNRFTNTNTAGPAIQLPTKVNATNTEVNDNDATVSLVYVGAGNPMIGSWGTIRHKGNRCNGASSIDETVKAVTASYTALGDDDTICISGSTAITVTLPATPQIGKKYTVKRTDASATVHTVDCGASLIDGRSKFSITQPYQSVTFLYTAAGVYSAVVNLASNVLVPGTLADITAQITSAAAGSTLTVPQGVVLDLGNADLAMVSNRKIVGPGKISNGRITLAGTTFVELRGLDLDNCTISFGAGCSDTIIQDCEIHNIAKDHWGGISWGGFANNIKILNNRIHDIQPSVLDVSHMTTYGAAIKCDTSSAVGCSNVVISGNDIYNIWGPAGIWVGSNNTTAYLEDFHIDNNRVHDTYSFGIEFFGSPKPTRWTRTRRFTIHNNTVYRTGALKTKALNTVDNGKGSGGIFGWVPDVNDISIMYNYVHTIMEVGIEMAWCEVAYNLVEDTGCDQLWYQINDSSCCFAARSCHHNTFVNPGEQGGYMMYRTGTVSGVDVSNNTIKNEFTPWAPATDYSVGDLIASVNNRCWFICTQAGRSGTVEPLGKVSGIVDGTCLWDYKKPLARVAIEINSTTGVENLTVTNNTIREMTVAVSTSPILNNVTVEGNKRVNKIVKRGMDLTSWGGSSGDYVSFDTKEVVSTAIPTVGNFYRGDYYRIQTPVAGQYEKYVCMDKGTLGTLTGVTGTVTSGSSALSVNADAPIQMGDVLQYPGSTQRYHVLYIDTYADHKTITTDFSSNVTLTGAAISYYPPVFKGVGAIAA